MGKAWPHFCIGASSIFELRLVIPARQEKMFDGLPRDLLPELRADSG
jgi:hypothetical protein